MYSIDYTHQFKKDLRKCASNHPTINNDETRYDEGAG